MKLQEKLRNHTIAILRSFLPCRVRKFILRLGVSLAPKDFQNYAYRLANAPNQQLGLRALSTQGFSPKNVVDVGAYEGEWTLMVKKIWPSSSITMIEPNPEKSKKLQGLAKNLDARLSQDLLGAVDGEVVEFNIMETGSSVFGERSDVPRTMRSLRVRTLDSVVGDIEVDLLKIDVQGYELQVLRGAERVLQKANVILLELSLIDVNEGAPIFHELIDFLAKRQFVIYDIVEFHRRPLDKALWQIDCVFVRISSPLRENRRFN